MPIIVREFSRKVFSLGSDKFTFGQYAGMTFEAVCNENPRYIEWCLGNIKGFEVIGAAKFIYDPAIEEANSNFFPPYCNDNDSWFGMAEQFGE